MVENTMFESAQASCSIASCELKKFGCDENYDGDNLAIVDKGIHGVMNLKYGFKEKICYKCTDNNGDTVEKDGLTLLSKGESKEFVQNYPKGYICDATPLSYQDDKTPA